MQSKADIEGYNGTYHLFYFLFCPLFSHFFSSLNTAIIAASEQSFVSERNLKLSFPGPWLDVYSS